MTKMNILLERESCLSVRMMIFKLPCQLLLSATVVIAVSAWSCTWGHKSPLQTLVYDLWYLDCNLVMPVLELFIHLNTTALKNKGSDLETTVSFSLGFIFSVFGFSSSSYWLTATCVFIEILSTHAACGISGYPCVMFYR